MFSGKIVFIVGGTAIGVGSPDEIMVGCSFCQENNQGGSEGDLWCIRNTAGREYDDDCYEVEKVVIDQGCGRL